MKKLLSIIGAIGITATVTSNIVACGGEKTKTVKQPLISQQPQTPVIKTRSTSISQQPQTPVIKKTTLDNKKLLISIVQSKNENWLNFLINNDFIDNLEITKYDFYIIKNWKTSTYNDTVEIRQKILNLLENHKEELWNEIKNKNSTELEKYNEENFKIKKVGVVSTMNVNGKEYIVFSLEFNISKEEINKNYKIDIYKRINERLIEPLWM